MMFYSVVQLMHIECEICLAISVFVALIQYTIAVCMVMVLAIDSIVLYCM